MNPTAALREQFARWGLRGRAPEASPVTLTQRRIFVLPTRAGIGFGASLVVLLLGSINYNLSLGYLLTFLLGGFGVVAILHTFRNLARLKVSRGRTASVFAGEPARFHLHLSSDIERHGIRLWVADAQSVSVDLPVGETVEAILTLPTQKRGWRVLPRFGIDTTWPTGLVRAWAYAAPDMRCLVYPRPANDAPDLPWSAGDIGQRPHESRGSDDFAGLRDHQPADPPRHVAWKTAARLGETSPLLTKQFDGGASDRIVLHWDDTAGHDTEQRLAILTRWALDADAAGYAWGLSLPGTHLPPANGDAHLHAALTALALYEQA